MSAQQHRPFSLGIVLQSSSLKGHSLSEFVWQLIVSEALPSPVIHLVGVPLAEDLTEVGAYPLNGQLRLVLRFASARPGLLPAPMARSARTRGQQAAGSRQHASVHLPVY